MIKLLSALEAWTKTNKVNDALEIQNILKLIQNAINKGKYSLPCPNNITEKQKLIITSLGYQFKYGNISWNYDFNVGVKNND